ncbi:hypothetical protein [Clostridium beijerinckii]|uniref:hypothetical protein n=1 Tax=Clostridium beijerinckii TaxID=1520 RepID=UPI0015707C7B|nr:hypothetical protein [Clostridium beijerinckii]NRU52407.1 hypothetical protein [Clostridium beijerinckii]NYC69148.1 hypothetical protein [Clostridium beijerinckii]NYC91898.1 hypothetical protein [Clostridium beijerinckii]
MDFTLEELKELKHCINSTIGLRIQYDCVLDEGKRKEDNDKWLADDYKLLARIVREIDLRKIEDKECQ